MPDPSAPTPPILVTWASLPRAVQLITVAFILANLGGAMFYDQLAVYLTSELGADINQLGVFFVVSAIIGSITRILGGWISDAIGHFRGLAVGSTLGCTGAVLMWWAPHWTIALACYIFVLMGMSLVGPSANAAITELTPKAIRSRIFGITGGVFQIVGVAGPYVGGLLIASYGWSTVLALNAILLGVATLLRGGLIVYETAPLERPRWRRLSRDLRWFYGSLLTGGVFGILLLLDITMDFQINMTFNLRSLFLEKERLLSADWRGLLFTISGVAAMPAFFLGGWLGDRIGEIRTILIGIGMGIIGYATFTLAQDFNAMIVPFVAWGMMVGLNEPTFRSLISKTIPKDRLATAYGTIFGSTNFAAFPAAKLGPYLYDSFTPDLPFKVAAIAQCLTLIGLLLASRYLRRRIDEESEAVQ